MVTGDLNTQFSSGDINEITIILEKYNLAKIIGKTKLLFKNTRTQIPDIGFISCCLLTTINFNIGTIRKHEQKIRIEGILTDLIFEIYIDFLNSSFLPTDLGWNRSVVFSPPLGWACSHRVSSSSA